MKSVRILGIDPGLQTTGFGVVDADGHTLRYVASGTITHHPPGPRQPAGAAEGAVRRHRARSQQRYQPDVAAVEIVFVNVNPQATLLLGQARGACVTALVSCDLAVAEYTALQMKQAVAGHGKAAKAQVQEMVKRLLRLPGLPGPGCGRCAGPGDHACARRSGDGPAGAGRRYGAQGQRACTRAGGRTERVVIG